MNDIVFLDRDQTLGDWGNGSGLYPGAESFCLSQVQKGRALVVTTASTQQGRKLLRPLDGLLLDYFGSDRCGADWYHAPDGALRRLEEDYARRRDFPDVFRAQIRERKGLTQQIFDYLDTTNCGIDAVDPALRARVSALRDFLNTHIHRITGEEFDRSKIYSNPFIGEGGMTKDFHFMKRYLNPHGYADTRAVMVGNREDIGFTRTDPTVPIVVVYPGKEQLRHGYAPVASVLDVLLGSTARNPHQVFDELFSQGPVLRLDEWTYFLERTPENSRILKTARDG